MQHMQFCLLQVRFQLIISTDGTTSFASFIYQEPERIRNLTSNGGFAVKTGFDAGDGNRGVTLSAENHSLQRVNTFRIDGKV